MAVVDGLEVVEVQHEDGLRRHGMAGAVELVLGLVVPRLGVEQPGLGVEGGRLLQTPHQGGALEEEERQQHQGRQPGVDDEDGGHHRAQREGRDLEQVLVPFPDQLAEVRATPGADRDGARDEGAVQGEEHQHAEREHGQRAAGGVEQGHVGPDHAA